MGKRPSSPGLDIQYYAGTAAVLMIEVCVDILMLPLFEIFSCLGYNEQAQPSSGSL